MRVKINGKRYKLTGLALALYITAPVITAVVGTAVFYFMMVALY